MELILLERVEKLGQMGDLVDVKPGYARNYLLPQKKALRATKANREYFETQRKDIEAANLSAKKEAEAVAKKIDGKKVVLLRQAGESGQLYGSATSRDIALAFSEEGLKIRRAQVILDGPIKELGIHKVKIQLHAEVSVMTSVNVARSAEEAELQIDAVTAVFESKELAEAAVEDLTEAPVVEAANEEATAADEGVDAADGEAADEEKSAN